MFRLGLIPPLVFFMSSQEHNSKARQQKKSSRTYTGWSEAEAKLFFEGIMTYGCELRKISQQMGTKTYDQVQSNLPALLQKKTNLSLWLICKL